MHASILILLYSYGRIYAFHAGYDARLKYYRLVTIIIDYHLVSENNG